MTKLGNQNATKTGADAAIKRLEDGGPFAPIAAEELARVESQLELKGIADIQVQNATRIQTACNLYWTAIEKAAQDHDLIALDKFCARYGWLVGVATRAWIEVKADRKGKGGRIDEVLEAYAKERENSPQEGQGGTE